MEDCIDKLVIEQQTFRWLTHLPTLLPPPQKKKNNPQTKTTTTITTKNNKPYDHFISSNDVCMSLPQLNLAFSSRGPLVPRRQTVCGALLPDGRRCQHAITVWRYSVFSNTFLQTLTLKIGQENQWLNLSGVATMVWIVILPSFCAGHLLSNTFAGRLLTSADRSYL